MGATPLKYQEPLKKDSVVHYAKENFGQLWPVHVDALIDMFSRFRAAFDGDLDSAFIMMVIGSAMLPKDKLPRGLSYDQYARLPGDRFATELNTNSIAQITGIPRETVRRKIGAMEKRGWLKRDMLGHWKVTRKGAADLQATTDWSLDYLSSIARTVQSAGPA